MVLTSSVLSLPRGSLALPMALATLPWLALSSSPQTDLQELGLLAFLLAALLRLVELVGLVRLLPLQVPAVPALLSPPIPSEPLLGLPSTLHRPELLQHLHLGCRKRIMSIGGKLPDFKATGPKALLVGTTLPPKLTWYSHV